MSLTYPALFFGGAALVSVPIIIHLLNKRKFKIVDWAAMDFLFEADKKNRRRVRLEDLLILLLRVGAVLLLAALLARPFLSGASAALLGGKVGAERIVLLDDSPSMEARQEGTTALAQGRRLLAELVRELSTNHKSDTLTVLVTSRPQQPIVSEAVLTPETVDRLTAELSAWPVSSRAAHYRDALAELEKLIAGRTSHLNRMVYVISDLRRSDWNAGKKGDEAVEPVSAFKRVAENTAGCFLVDVGGALTENLAITSLVPLEKVLAAGQTCRFEVKVKNYGPTEVENVGIRLTPVGSLPVNERIPRIAAGEEAAVPMDLTFPVAENERAPEPVALHAELTLSGGSTDDRLAADNSRYFPARVTEGIRTLVMDGDPTVDPKRAETYFLRRALAPPGAMQSVIVPRVVSAAEFESVDLEAYQVVYLANVDQLSDERRTALETWVKRGGGLVMVLGDRLADLGWFNARMYRNGTGLSPAEVQSIQGNEHRRQWAKVDVVAPKGHEAVAVYAGENNPFLEGVKVFRWWKCQLPEAPIKEREVRLLARLTDADQSPLIVEGRFGDGRVILLTSPLDKDWSTWPQEQHAYVLFVQFLTRYMAQPTAKSGLIEIGEQIKVPLDVVRHKMEGTLTRPSGERSAISPEQEQSAANGGALPAPVLQGTGSTVVDMPKSDKAPTGSSEKSQSVGEPGWHVSTTETNAPGVYRIDIPLRDGGTESAIFAANLAADESILTPLDPAELKQQLADSRVQLLAADALLAVDAADAKAEWWLVMLGGLGIVLGTEQLLAWLFGRRR